MTARIAYWFLALVLAAASGLAVAGNLDKISNQDAVSGQKAALEKGSTVAVNNLARTDGFFGNDNVKIPLPDSLKRYERTMRSLGMGKYADELILTMNRAAEAAVPEAKVLLVDAVKKMSVQDAKGVLTGGDTAGPEYFKRTTSDPLRARFLPIVQQSTKKVKLAESYNNYAGQAAKFGLVSKEHANLDAYVTQKALDGLYYTKLIEVGYEDLPLVTDPVEAMKPDSPRVHEQIGDSNICVHYKIRKGSVEQGFAQAEAIVESEYRTPVQEHAYLQPEAGLAYIDEEGRIAIESGGQWTHEDRHQIAHALNLPNERVRIIYPAIGGAFGGREDMSVQIVLALAAWKLLRPVEIIWSRQESIIGHGKRHASLIRAKWGATKEGKLVAIEKEMIADGGAYMYTSNKVLGNSAITSSGPYFVPNIKTDVYGVYTNNVPGAAFRGFGAPQALFMAEMQMDKLAEKLGLDPVEFRLQNALRDGDTMGVGRRRRAR